MRSMHVQARELGRDRSPHLGHTWNEKAAAAESGSLKKEENQRTVTKACEKHARSVSENTVLTSHPPK